MARTLLVLVLFTVLVIFDQQNLIFANSCTDNQYPCDNGRCIPLAWKCDGDDDCKDESDERNCPTKTCSATEFECDNSRCIPLRWQCDGDTDCEDGSDEDGRCDGRTCGSDQFSCGAGSICIPEAWRCDLDHDCANGQDEDACGELSCKANEFSCNNGNCITMRWVCDKDDDCKDGSDEVSCPEPTCSSSEFMCNNSYCIPRQWLCDGDYDCLDYSDESQASCGEIDQPASICSEREFTCRNQECIHISWYCDGDDDCTDSSDELNCPVATCRTDQFTCADSTCITSSLECDGNSDCPDESDETECQPDTTACLADSQFTCPDQTCVDNSRVCDGQRDCTDSADEPVECGINECQVNNGGCSQLCIDQAIGFKCSCTIGYELVGDGRTCQDIDECQLNGFCSQLCQNTKGSYKCSCQEGYSLEPNGRHCKVTHDDLQLMFSDRRDIRLIDLNTREYRLVVGEIRSAIALDFHFEHNWIYWTDVSFEKIFRAPMTLDDQERPAIEVVVENNLNTPDGLAVDWIYHNIYWTDTGTNRIEMARMDGSSRRTLFSQDLDEPRAVVLDPFNGWMYWTDWGMPAKIERAGMNGADRRTLVTDNLQWPNGLTIDYLAGKIYWVDAKLHSLSSCAVDGSQHQVVLQSDQLLQHPFSISVFEDYIYWTDWQAESIHRAGKFDGSDPEVIAEDLFSPMDIQVFHQLRQPVGTNHCGAGNGGCSHLCVPAPKISTRSAKYSCLCPSGVELLEDGRTCNIDGVTPWPRPRPDHTENSRPSLTSTEQPPAGNYSVHTASPATPQGHSGLKGTSVDTGVVAAITVGALILVAVIAILLAVCLYRQFKGRNKKTMNFDNPVYRKTTEDQLFIPKFSNDKYQHNNGVSYPPLRPQTEEPT